MKKLRNALLLAGVLAALLCVTALAESQSLDGGFYVTGKASGVTITPQTATGEKVSSTSADVDNQEEGYESFYPGAVKMAVTYNGSVASGENYVVLLVEGDALPTKDNAIYYINQETTASAGGAITFNVYPMDIAGQKDLTLYITSDKAGFETIAIPMGYAPAGSYEVQPYTLGDVDSNNAVNATDATYVLQSAVSLYELNSIQKLAADVDKSGTVNATDATYILQYSVSLIKDFGEIQKG